MQIARWARVQARTLFVPNAARTPKLIATRPVSYVTVPNPGISSDFSDGMVKTSIQRNRKATRSSLERSELVPTGEFTKALRGMISHRVAKNEKAAKNLHDGAGPHGQRRS